MFTAKDNFIIYSEQSTNNHTGVFIGGQELLIDTDFGRYKHAIRIGKVHILPLSISDKYVNDTKINVGDTAVVHHFVIQKESKIAGEKDLYLCNYYHIYAIIKDKQIMPIEDIIFVEPIDETEEDTTSKGFVTKTEKAGKVKQKGKVFASSKQAQKLGINAGDIVYFTSHGDYKINLVGQDLYRMKIRNIVAVERGEWFECMNGRILVANFSESLSKLKGWKVKKFGTSLTGLVKLIPKDVTSVKINDAINYSNALGNESIFHKGIHYNFVQEENINYILNGSETD